MFVLCCVALLYCSAVLLCCCVALLIWCVAQKQVFPHEYRRALAEADAIKKAEEEQKAAIKAAGERGFGV
jgi:hypothetical protein